MCNYVHTFCSYISAASMTHVDRDGLMEKMKELSIETLSVEHPDVRPCLLSLHKMLHCIVNV